MIVQGIYIGFPQHIEGNGKAYAYPMQYRISGKMVNIQYGSRTKFVTIGKNGELLIRGEGRGTNL